MPEQLPHHSFLTLAQTHPDRPALRNERTALTAGELARQALQTATVLAERGIGRGDAVGVSISDPVRCIPAVLGILTTGARCVPLAEGLPARRQEGLLCNNGVRILLTDHPQARTPTTSDPTPQNSSAPYDVAPTWRIAQLPLALAESAEPLRLAPARRTGRVAWVYPSNNRRAGAAHLLTHRDVARAADHLTSKDNRPRQVRLLIPSHSPLWPYAVFPALAQGIPLQGD
ncbi:AMP-binding protein [Streptomyces sp. NPDC057302]|uniref:AMP-binding protein n=1 Tax=Streptomyces sp. NPDC057302 TaxID=3346094 RepID=UPI0036292545